MPPDNSPESPTAVALSSAVAVHAAPAGGADFAAFGGYERVQTNAESETDARLALRGVDRHYRFGACLALP